jgi:tRNA(Arg) A34 adenosine deaminase TadA
MCGTRTRFKTSEPVTMCGSSEALAGIKQLYWRQRQGRALHFTTGWQRGFGKVLPARRVTETVLAH